MGWEKKSIGLESLQEHDSQPYAKQIHEKNCQDQHHAAQGAYNSKDTLLDIENSDRWGSNGSNWSLDVTKQRRD